ncbi:MAG TPA: efflux RND transporter periplasmic adaptor subunit [Kofleriaceae bacterium]|jgi:HlyD family secretion protein|nr:efflux RND transporter periplasmic adaptor subunit [Kofleriaceae bacterium]
MSPQAKRSPARFIPLVIIFGGLGWYGVHRWQLAHAPFEWSGTVEARTIDLGSRAGGRIKQILVKEGDRVKAGQPLLVLEAGDWPAQLEQAEGSLLQAQANLDKLKNGSRPEEIEAAKARAQTAQAALQETVTGTRPEEVAAAQARFVSAEVAVEKAQHDVDRLHKLRDAGAAIPADVDNAEINLKGAIAQRDASRQQLDELKNGSRREDVAQARARASEQLASERLLTAGSRVEDIRVAEAQVKVAQGHVDQTQNMIDELTIKAPSAMREGWTARVEALDLRPGDIIAPNSTAATLIEDDQLYVRIYVPETELGHIHVGDKVPISVDSFPNRTFQGDVEHINEVGEYSPRNLQTADERADQVFGTRVGIITGQDALRAGMAAFIKVSRE